MISNKKDQYDQIENISKSDIDLKINESDLNFLKNLDNSPSKQYIQLENQSNLQFHENFQNKNFLENFSKSMNPYNSSQNVHPLK